MPRDHPHHPPGHQPNGAVMCVNCREEPDTPPPPLERGRVLKPIPLKPRGAAAVSDDELTELSYYQADDGTIIALAVPAEMGDGSGVIPPPTITFARGPVPKAEWTTFLYQGGTRPGSEQEAQVPFARPCCHPTGPNHHPACQADIPGSGPVDAADASECPPQGDPMPANPDASQGGKP